jgi:spore germination protein GerM
MVLKSTFQFNKEEKKMRKGLVLLVTIFLFLFSSQAMACEVKLFFFNQEYEIVEVPFSIDMENLSKREIVKKVTEKLLQGPQDSLLTFIPEGTKLNYVVLLGGNVILDFSEELQSYGGGSFNVMKIRKQFDSLYQLPFIKEIIFTVEGKGEREGVLQP